VKKFSHAGCSFSFASRHRQQTDDAATRLPEDGMAHALEPAGIEPLSGFGIQDSGF
jgi:hypothetical protein